MSDWVDRLISIARGVLHQQQQVIANQVIGAVEEEVISAMQQHVQTVVGGVWVGRGADAFVDAISSEAMPMADQVVGEVSDLNNNLTRAEQIMDEADDRVYNLMNNLADTFDSIY